MSLGKGGRFRDTDKISGSDEMLGKLGGPVGVLYAECDFLGNLVDPGCRFNSVA